MRDYLAITKALSDETRLRLLMALRDQEVCLCQLAELVSLASSTVSKHMSILRQSRLVEGRRDGRWTYYRLADKDAPVAVRKALQWTLESLADDPRVARDVERLSEIILVNPQTLCDDTCSPKKGVAPAVGAKRLRPAAGSSR
jgi:DNA-binding transcriptional ArsR family regulator